MRKRYFLGACIGAFAAVISHLPLSWVAPHLVPDSLGQSIVYSGTVWDGQVSGVDYLGTVIFKVNPRAFFTGGLPVSFKTQSTAMSVSGKASQKQLKDIRFTGSLAKLPTRDGRLKELAGTVNIHLEELRIEEGSCASASGKASTDFLTLNRSRWQWQGPELSGPISCEDGDLLASLSGNENRQTVRADLRLSPDGSYSADITLRTNQPEAGVVLPLYGFEAVGRDYKLLERGQWR